MRKLESPHLPVVEVRNNGKTAVDFPVLLSTGTGHADTVRVNGLAAAQAETLEFSPWVAPPRCSRSA